MLQILFAELLAAHLKLLILHPYFIRFWMQCVDLMGFLLVDESGNEQAGRLADMYVTGVHYVRENSKHTISDACHVNRKQIEDQRSWVGFEVGRDGVRVQD